MHIEAGDRVLALCSEEFRQLKALMALKPVKHRAVTETAPAHLQPTTGRRMGTTPEDHGDPMFARGIAGPLGKLTADAKTKIDEVTHEVVAAALCFARAGHRRGAARDCIYALVHGKTYRQMVVDKISHDSKRIDAGEAHRAVPGSERRAPGDERDPRHHGGDAPSP